MPTDLKKDNGMLTPDDINWFHSINLGNGIITRGYKSPALLEEEFARLGLNAATLRDKLVLDIGCNDGFMSIRCEELGAHVTAIDGVYRDGLKYIRKHLRPKFRFYMIDLMSPTFSELGRFDVILYLGILYHTMYPFEQLVRVATACNAGATLFLESEYYNLPGFDDEPTIIFNYSGQIIADLWSPVFPSIAWIVQTLKRVGFEDVTVLHRVGNDQRGRVTLRGRYGGGSSLSPCLYAGEQV
jgi:tRNA (mo5U34)-methyltransferase